MRQLGARLPEPPRAEAPRETRRFEELNAEPARYDTLRERSIGLEAVPRQEGTPWGLLQREFDSEEEKGHRFPFLTLAVPAIAAVLALGAFLWSGSLRDRLRQQDAAMNALQAQNQKMADTLEEMSVEQKASNALSSSGSQPAYNAPLRQPAQQKPQTNAKPVAQAPATQQTEDQKKPEPAGSEPVQTQPSVAAPAVNQSAPIVQPPSTQPQGKPAPSNPRESYPSPMANEPTAQAKRNTPSSEPARQSKPADAGHSPELVAPYPTNYRPLTATNVAAGGSPAPPASGYHAPFSVAGSSHPATASSAVSQTGAQQPATPPIVNHSPSLPSQYNAAGNAAYAGALAENVEAVQGLQRHSTVPLQEFHVHEGMVTNVTPALGLSVRHPDPGHGTYSLVVNANGAGYQLRGQVNNPLVFTDNTTHREYELVVLKIADRQVYGYVRAMR